MDINVLYMKHELWFRAAGEYYTTTKFEVLFCLFTLFSPISFYSEMSMKTLKNNIFNLGK